MTLLCLFGYEVRSEHSRRTFCCGYEARKTTTTKRLGAPPRCGASTERTGHRHGPDGNSPLAHRPKAFVWTDSERRPPLSELVIRPSIGRPRKGPRHFLRTGEGPVRPPIVDPVDRPGASFGRLSIPYRDFGETRSSASCATHICHEAAPPGPAARELSTGQEHVAWRRHRPADRPRRRHDASEAFSAAPVARRGTIARPRRCRSLAALAGRAVLGAGRRRAALRGPELLLDSAPAGLPWSFTSSTPCVQYGALSLPRQRLAAWIRRRRRLVSSNGKRLDCRAGIARSLRLGRKRITLPLGGSRRTTISGGPRACDEISFRRRRRRRIMRAQIAGVASTRLVAPVVFPCRPRGPRASPAKGIASSHPRRRGRAGRRLGAQACSRISDTTSSRSRFGRPRSPRPTPTIHLSSWHQSGGGRTSSRRRFGHCPVGRISSPPLCRPARGSNRQGRLDAAHLQAVSPTRSARRAHLFAPGLSYPT